MIDEAHSTFIYGENGRGVAEVLRLEDQIDIHVGTLSKALGGQGGFVAGSRQPATSTSRASRARGCFSCALSPVVAAGRARGAAHRRRASPGCATACGPTSRTSAGCSREEGIDVGESTSQVIPVHDPQRSAHLRDRATSCSAPGSIYSRSSTRRWPSTARASASRSRRPTPTTSSTRASRSWPACCSARRACC